LAADAEDVRLVGGLYRGGVGGTGRGAATGEDAARAGQRASPGAAGAGAGGAGRSSAPPGYPRPEAPRGAGGVVRGAGVVIGDAARAGQRASPGAAGAGAGGAGRSSAPPGYPRLESPDGAGELIRGADVVIDVSAPSFLERVLDVQEDALAGRALIVGTTGLDS